MKFTTNLVFKDNCEEAFRFYENVLGGKLIALIRVKDSPIAAEFPPESANMVLHAMLQVGEGILMGSDSPPNCPGSGPMSGFHVHLHAETPESAETLFASLSHGGNILMPISETFWAHRFGVLVDRYGTPWMVNCAKSLAPA